MGRALRHGGDRGASAVEFALVLPILLALVMALLEFGWAFNGWITLTGAAREGARVAAVDKSDANVMAAVAKHTTTFPTTPIPVVDRTTNPDAVRVSVTGALPPLVGFFRWGDWGSFKNGDWEIKADATMRREYAN